VQREKKKTPQRCLVSNRKIDQRMLNLGSMGPAARAGEFAARNSLKGGVGGSQTHSLKSAETKRTVLPVLPVDDTVVRGPEILVGACLFSIVFSAAEHIDPWASWAVLENIMIVSRSESITS